jgi:hypothetical protein
MEFAVRTDIQCQLGVLTLSGTLMHARSIGAAALALLGALAFLGACGSSSDADVPAHNPDGITIVRGTVVRIAPGAFDVKTNDSVTTLTVAQPFHLYARVPSELSQVSDSTFVGVTTVKQPDGTEQATEVHIFPSELRGLGEGSYMMNQSAGATPSRMTNGSAAPSRMTNGSAAPARMTNGSATNSGGSTLVVHYAGHARTIVVPPSTPVTVLQLTTDTLAVGSRAVVVARTGSNGALTASAAILAPQTPTAR